jgi:dolichol-phosphate mannosyltransferase
VSKKPVVVIILPTYNEVDNIGIVVELLEKVFQKESAYDFSILVVDDNSPDGTSGVVKNLSKKFPNIFLLTGEKNGLGAAYVRGMHYAVDKLKANILFEMDADQQHDPKLIPLFLRKLEEGADYVVGSRYIKGGSIPKNWGIDRKIFSVAGNIVIRLGLMLPRIHEWTNGYRAMRAGVFQKISNGLDAYKGYIFQIASMHRVVQAHFKIAEVPVNFTDRKYGNSKIIPTEYIPDILRYILFHSSFVRFGIVGVIGFIINATALEVFYRIGFTPGVSAAIGAEFAVVSNFIFNNFWTFSHKKIEKRTNIPLKFLHFNTVAIGAISIQSFVVGWGTSVFGDHYRFVLLVFAVGVFVVPYSYFMYNRFIWKHPQK